MPFIDPQLRPQFEKAIASLDNHLGSQDDGEFVYILYTLAKRYLKKSNLSFSDRSRVAGLLRSCEDEFRRNELHPYEEGKKLKNGDVS